MGANRRDLIYQFFGESFLTTLVAVLLTTVLMTVLLPFFNRFAEVNLSLPVDTPVFPLLLLAVVVGVGLLAGSYPALFLSSFVPVAAPKG